MEEYSRIQRGLDEVLDKDWDRASSALDELTQALSEDPTPIPGMAETAKAASRAMKEMPGEEFGKAKEAGPASMSGPRAFTKPSRRRWAGLPSFLKEGGEVQAFQDYWNEAHRMDQAGSELSGKIERMAQGGRPRAPRSSGSSREAFDSLKSQMEALTRSIQSLPKAEPGSPQETRTGRPSWSPWARRLPR